MCLLEIQNRSKYGAYKSLSGQVYQGEPLASERSMWQKPWVGTPDDGLSLRYGTWRLHILHRQPLLICFHAIETMAHPELAAWSIISLTRGSGLFPTQWSLMQNHLYPSHIHLSLFHSLCLSILKYSKSVEVHLWEPSCHISIRAKTFFQIVFLGALTLLGRGGWREPRITIRKSYTCFYVC